MKVKVKVTQEDISNGAVWNACKCPVALALNRTLGRVVRVTTASWWACNEPTKLRELPPEALEFILKFDAGLEVAPFEFEVEDDHA